MRKLLTIPLLLTMTLLLQAQATAPTVSDTDQQKLQVVFKEYVDALNAAEMARLKFVANKFEVMSQNKVSSTEYDMVPTGTGFIYQKKEDANAKKVNAPKPAMPAKPSS